MTSAVTGGGDAPADGTAAQIARYRTMIDDLRKRSEITAKAVGGLSLTILSAVGFSRLAHVFPLPPDKAGGHDTALIAAWAALGGFVAIAIVVLCFATRLWNLQRPVVVDTETEIGARTPLASENRASGESKKDLARIWKAIAQRNAAELEERDRRDWAFASVLSNQAASLRVFEQRGLNLARAADLREGAGANAQSLAMMRRQSEAIAAQVHLALALAGVDIARTRAKRVIADRVAIALSALFVLGLVCLVGGTDYLASERVDKPAIAKTCVALGVYPTHSSYCNSADLEIKQRAIDTLKLEKAICAKSDAVEKAAFACAQLATRAKAVAALP